MPYDYETNLSVIVPVYNIETNYLDQCIASLVNQTEKIEIIIVDDGSQDKCKKRCDDYVALYKNANIKVIHQPNQGVSAARNKGVSVAQGEYIGFVDADDWVEREVYREMLEFTKKYNCDIIISGFVRENENKSSTPYEEVFNNETALEEMFKRELFVWSVCDKLYRREILERFKVSFSTKYKMGEDLEFNYKAFKNAKVIGYKRLNGYHYRMRSDSATHKKNPDKKWDSVQIMREIINEASDKQKIYLRKLYFKEMVSCLFHAVMYGKKTDDEKSIIYLQREIRKMWSLDILENLSLKIKVASLISYLPINLVNLVRR